MSFMKNGFSEKVRKNITVVSSCAATAFLIGCTVYSTINGADASNKISVGEVADYKIKDITLNSFFGREQFNAIEKKGAVVVINFWATWCTPCVEELPDFEQVAKSFDDDVFIAAVHSYDITDDAEKFLQLKYGKNEQGEYDAPNWKLTFVQDGPKGEETSVLDAFGLQGAFPSTVILNKNSVVSAVYEKTLTAKELTKAIESAMTTY